MFDKNCCDVARSRELLAEADVDKILERLVSKIKKKKFQENKEL